MTITELFTELAPTVEHLRATTAHVLPRLIVAAAIGFMGWILASLLRAFARRLSSAVGRGLPDGAAKSALLQALVDRGGHNVIASGAYWFVLLATAMIASEALGLQVLTAWLAAAATYLPRIVLAAAVILGGLALGKVASDAALSIATRVSPPQARRLARAIRSAVVVVSVLVAAGQLGLDISFLSSTFLIVLGSTLGSAALAFALGARTEIANILGMHYVNKNYAIGQSIRVGADVGRIVRTSATSVFLECADGELAIPGAVFSQERCVLMTAVPSHA